MSINILVICILIENICVLMVIMDVVAEYISIFGMTMMEIKRVKSIITFF